MSKVVIVSGSPNPESRLTGIIRHAERRLVGASVYAGHIEVAALPAEDLILARFDSPAIVEANAKIADADAIVIVSPVYKAAYTGVLKTYLDLLPQKALAGKIIAPLFLGGSIAHLLAIDYSLKPVLGALGANRFSGSVYAVDSQITRVREEPGGLRYELEAELSSRLDQALNDLLHQLEVEQYA
jgi:FMN reductase